MTFLLSQVLIQPSRISDLDATALHALIAQGRNSRLLASLASELDKAGILDQLPYRVRRHFSSAMLVWHKQKRDLAFDVEKIRTALAGVGLDVVLLKGAAYLMAELTPGQGRLLTDIDILVPAQAINAAREALQAAGWVSHKLSNYDKEYYRKWSHEIPAMTHPRRDTTLDVHHSILPPTAGPAINPNLLFEALVQLQPGLYTLSPEDMVIHSATHLFHEGEFHHGLRDLWDLDRMLRDFPRRRPDFWFKLSTRAHELDLSGSLYHGLIYSREVFDTPIPADTLARVGSRSRALRRPLMDFLYRRALRPNHPQCRLPFSDLALSLLYVRSHYLRMPMRLLVPHLARKAWMRRFPQNDAPGAETVN